MKSWDLWFYIQHVVRSVLHIYYFHPHCLLTHLVSSFLIHTLLIYFVCFILVWAFPYQELGNNQHSLSIVVVV